MNYPRLTARQAKKVSQVVGVDRNCNSPLYSETTNSEIFLDEKKKAKIMK